MPAGDDDAVERGARGAGLLHQALAAELQLPQVRIEEQRVELDRAARLEQVRQLRDVVGEDLLGDLSATGELGPVAGVGRGGDDLRVDRRRGHAGEQHRRATGERGERGLDDDAAVGQLTLRWARTRSTRAATSGARRG